MVTNGKEVHVNEMMDSIILKLGHLRDLLIDMAKNGEASTEDKWNEVIMYSPDEWDEIAFTVQHFNHFMKELNALKSQDEIDAYYTKNIRFLALVYDLSNHWYVRLENMKKEKQA